MRTLAPLLVAAALAAPLGAQQPDADPPAPRAAGLSPADAARLAPDTTRTRKDGESGSVFPMFLPDPRWEPAPAASRADLVAGADDPVGEEAAAAPDDAIPPADRWLMLTGTGVREKTIFAVNVYTVGLYLDPLAAHHELAAFRGGDGKSLSRNERLYEALAEPDLFKLLRLEMNRDVGSDDMREAFDDSLAPRIRALARDAAEREAGLAALARFRAFFGGTSARLTPATRTNFELETLPEGARIEFAFHPGGRLDASIRLERRRAASTTTITLGDRFESPLLAAALLDVYLGDKPVSGAARKAFARGLPDVLARGAALDAADAAWPRPAPPSPGADGDADAPASDTPREAGDR